MAKLVVPDGPRLRWGNRRGSRVEIVHTLKPGPRARGIPFTLSLPRRCFGNFDREIEALEAVWSAALVAERRMRLRGGPLEVVARLRADRSSRVKLSMPRSALPRLRQEIQELQVGGYDAAEFLALRLYARCFTDFVAELVAVTPRGNLQARRFTLLLPAAFMAVHDLVAMGHRDPRVRQRIQGVVDDDPSLSEYLANVERRDWSLQHGLVVGLTARAFRGVAGRLTRRNPTELLREYFYGRARPLGKPLREHPLLRRLYRSSSEAIFLGEPGAAARAFRLVQ